MTHKVTRFSEGSGATRVFKVDPGMPNPAVLEEAGRVLRSGGLVAFPTETVYGLGADAFNPAAVARIFEVKGRPASDPLIVHIADREDLYRVAREVPEVALRLAEQFMPGPLTFVLWKRPEVPDVITAGKPTVAVRMPAHPIALGLIRAAGVPVVAPSANRFGHTSPTRAEHVLDDLGGKVDLVLDAGPTPVGVESTIIDLTQSPPVILRPGGVPREALERILGVALPVARPALSEEEVKAPGMMSRHYAPEQAELWLFLGEEEDAPEWFRKVAESLTREGRRVGILLYEEDRDKILPCLPADVEVEVLGAAGKPEELARRLYAALRDLERRVDVILARDIPPSGMGLAVRDRLRRAATRLVEHMDPRERQ